MSEGADEPRRDGSPGDLPVGSPAVRRVVRRVGDRALLVDCADGRHARGLHAALLADPVPGQGELLTGARTVLVRLADPTAVDRVARALAVVPAAPVERSGAAPLVLDTVYDGADLDDVARSLGLSPEAFVRAHADRTWTAAFVGFAPGFAYLEPDGSVWDVPRRASPRTAVPAGSVALAGAWSAVYPRASPGGWQLVGRTDAVLWDLRRAEPALLRPGARVRFRPVRARARAAVAPPPRGEDGAGSPRGRHDSPPARSAPVPGTGTGPAPPSGGLEVVATGPLALVQDLGRPGHLDLGVGPSGALDRGAAVRANRLVGNPRGAAVVEALLGGLTLRARGPRVLAVTGAPVDVIRRGADGAVLAAPGLGRPFRLDDGEALVLGMPPVGLRSYVAIRGGLAVDVVLGSRSTDVLSGLGPPPLRPGDVLGVLDPSGDAVAGAPDPPAPTRAGPVTVRVVPGPRDDWFAEAAVDRLCATPWTVGVDSNRVGLRLSGDPLARTRTDELPSEGVVAGAVQVPPSGLPVVFLADHPVTGGYPVVAVVRDADLDALAQVRPGDALRFVPD